MIKLAPPLAESQRDGGRAAQDNELISPGAVTAILFFMESINTHAMTYS